MRAGPWRRWTGWIGYAAAACSLIYGAFGLYRALEGAGFPFWSENDPDAALSALGGLTALAYARRKTDDGRGRSGGRTVAR